VTIQVKGRGVALRDELTGSGIGTKRQFEVLEGQFVLSKIDARNGAFGLVPAECSGAIITGNFWTFDVDDSLLYPGLLVHVVQSPLFIDFCIKASPGATNRRYLQESAFLAQTIRVPERPGDQQRLADLLDGLRGGNAVVRSALQQASESASAQLGAALYALFDSDGPS
jgi:type I restriction enzyme S subunit